MTHFRSFFRKPIFAFMLLVGCNIACAQEYVYVNTANLLLRDRPEAKYNVYNILQPPCRLEIVKDDDMGYERRAFKDRFYHVLLRVHNDKTMSSYRSYGWVEKKYMVKSIGKVTAHYADTTGLSFIDVPISDDFSKLNYRSYPYPKYKGGEQNFGAEYKRKYQKGPRGGCYYINEKGRKVYVDAGMCR